MVRPRRRAVHAFGVELLKFIGDGVLVILPVTGLQARPARRRCALSPLPAPAWLISIWRGRRRAAAAALRPALHLGEIPVGQYRCGRPARLHRDRPGGHNLVCRLEGLCRSLGRSVLISGAIAAETHYTAGAARRTRAARHRRTLRRLRGAGRVSRRSRAEQNSLKTGNSARRLQRLGGELSVIVGA
jgi:class 3 adenylate cyclase